MKKIPFFFLFFLIIVPLGYSYLSVESDISQMHICSYEEFNVKVRNTGTDAVYDLLIQSNNPYINFKSSRFELKSQDTYTIPVKLNVECGKFENINMTNLTLTFKNYDLNYEEKYVVQPSLVRQNVLVTTSTKVTSDDFNHYITYNINNNNTFTDKYSVKYIFSKNNNSINQSELNILNYILENSNSSLIFQINTSDRLETISFDFKDILNDEYENKEYEYIISGNEDFSILNQISKENLLILNLLNIDYYIKIISNNYGDVEYLSPMILEKELTENLEFDFDDVEINFNSSNLQNYQFNENSIILLSDNLNKELRSLKIIENNKTIDKFSKFFYPKEFLTLGENQILKFKYSDDFKDTLFTRYYFNDNELIVENYNVNIDVPKNMTLKHLIIQILMIVLIIILFLVAIFLIIKNRIKLKSNLNKLGKTIKSKNKKRIEKKTEKKALKLKERLEKKSLFRKKSKKDILVVKDNSNFILEEKVKKSIEAGYSNSKIDNNVKRDKFFKEIKKKFKKFFLRLKNVIKVFCVKLCKRIKSIFLFIRKFFWIILLVLIVLLSIFLIVDYNTFNNEKVLNYSDNQNVTSLRDFYYYSQNLTNEFRNDTFFTNFAFLTLLYEKTNLIEDKIIIGDSLRFDKDKYFSDPDKEGLDMKYVIDYFIPLNLKYSDKVSLEDLEISENDKFFKDSQEGIYKLKAKVYDEYNESAESEYFYYLNYKAKDRYDFFTYLKYKFFN